MNLGAIQSILFVVGLVCFRFLEFLVHENDSPDLNFQSAHWDIILLSHLYIFV